MEVCSWWAQRSRRWPCPIQIHRKSWRDHQAPTGTADPSQEYNLRDLSSSKDERIRQPRPKREDACSLNLLGLRYLCKPGVDPVLQVILRSLMPFLESIHPFTSGWGLNLIWKEVAGGSGGCAPCWPQLVEHLVSFFFFNVQSTHILCSPESKHF